MNKGFTLIEVLAVLVILGIIALIAFPIVNGIINQGKEVTHQAQVNNILTAAYDYSLKNMNYLPDEGEKKYILLAQLKEKGFLTSDVIDPETLEQFSDDLIIVVENVGKNYKTDLKEYKLKGNYLYYIKTDKNKENLPIITLDGLDPIKENTYLINLNKNEEFIEPTVSTDSSDNTIVKLMYQDDKFASEINTKEEGMYKIIYTVLDIDGNSNKITLNIIIEDKEPPVINIPGNVTLSKDITSYDFMKDVTCTDNSEKCDLSYTDDVQFQVEGKYVVTYTAIDLKGNTSTKKRVVTIK